MYDYIFSWDPDGCFTGPEDVFFPFDIGPFIGYHQVKSPLVSINRPLWINNHKIECEMEIRYNKVYVSVYIYSPEFGMFSFLTLSSR